MEKIINVTSPLMPEFERYVEELKKIWDSRWLTNNGPEYVEFQHKLEALLGNKVELYVNGHMALDIAIKTLKLKGEVITTPYTFASTTHALVMNGLTPVFCDIKDDYTIDEDKIEALITDKTSAILAVHVYGCICNVEKIEEIARRHNLKVIYDAAHAFAVKRNGKSIAEYGDISMFSLHATKVFNSIEGGILVYHDEKYSTELRNLRNFGIENVESVTSVGLNAKMNEFAAAMGICNLEILEEAIATRKSIVERYLKTIQSVKGIKTLDYEEIEKNGIEYNYAYMPIEIDESITGFTRDDLYEFLKTKNIISRKYFYPIVSDYECYRDKFDSNRTPNAKRIGDRILTLPIAASMTKEDVERCCSALQEMIGRAEA